MGISSNGMLSLVSDIYVLQDIVAT